MNAIMESLGQQNWMFLSSFAAFALAAAAYGLVALDKGGRALRLVATGLLVATFFLITALITQRWIEAGRPPFKSLYESLLLFVWCSAVLHIAVERFYRISWFGFMTSGFMFLTCGYAVIKTDAEIVNLPAALQSVWFVPHVVVYFFGYAAIFFAFVAALMHLWRPDQTLQLRRASGGTAEVTYAGFMHLAILFGFVLLTAGLVIGAIWAKVAWGDYWVWDPKENWALVSWLLFVIYLHLRYTKGFEERNAAILTIIGFAAIVFTYLGMHLLPTAEQSAHVYQ